MTRLICRAALLACTTVFGAGAATAQSLADSYTEGFLALADNEAALEAIIDERFSSTPADHRPLFREYMAYTLRIPGLADYLFAIGPPQAGEDPVDYYVRVGYLAIENTIGPGAGRLSTDYQLGFIAEMIKILEWTRENHPEHCGVLLGVTPGIVNWFDRERKNAQSVEEVSADHDFSLIAIAAEITDAPPVKTLSASQIAQADAVLLAALEASLFADEDPSGLLAAAVGTAEDPADYCDLMILSVEFVYDLEEPELGYVTQVIVGGR